MVIKKIKEAFSSTDDKYEALYYKYSKIKLENEKLKRNHASDLKEYKGKLHKKVAEELIEIYDAIEDAKNSSFKVKATDKELQRLLMDVNKTEKKLKEFMSKFTIEEIAPTERFYDPELHEVASYQSGKGMEKGLLLKTVKRGFKFKGEIVRKPKVVVTK